MQCNLRENSVGAENTVDFKILPVPDLAVESLSMFASSMTVVLDSAKDPNYKYKILKTTKLSMKINKDNNLKT